MRKPTPWEQPYVKLQIENQGLDVSDYIVCNNAPQIDWSQYNIRMSLFDQMRMDWSVPSFSVKAGFSRWR